MSDYISEARNSSKKLDDLVNQVQVLSREINVKVDALSLLTLISREDFSRNPEAVRKLGGEREVKIAVWNIYDRIIHDPITSSYFNGVNVDIVRKKQLQMFLALLGIGDYEGPSLHNIHHPHHVSAEAFDRMIDITNETLEDTGMEINLRNGFIKDLREFKPVIVDV